MLTFSQERGITSLSAAFFVSTALLLSGCASNQVSEADVDSVEVTEIDPYENFNRSMFSFNEGMDDYVAEPISDAYLWITPQFVQTGVANFFNNLDDINVVLNDVMQGKIGQGTEDTGRFAVNSTIGLLGLFDVATELGLEKHEEDFAQTLAVWGVPQGPYLVLPVLGPSTCRGIPGGIFDAAANPASYVAAPIQLIQLLNARANAEGALNFIDEAALDPYIFTREAFLQHRKHLITDGQSEITDDLLDLEDDFYDEDEDELPVKDNVPLTRMSTEDASAVIVTSVDRSLELVNPELNEFSQASASFDGAVKSFDDATRSFEEAAKKLNQLQNQ